MSTARSGADLMINFWRAMARWRESQGLDDAAEVALVEAYDALASFDFLEMDAAEERDPSAPWNTGGEG